MRFLVFDKLLLVVFHRQIESVSGNHATGVEGIFVGMPQADLAVVLDLGFRLVELGHPPGHLDCGRQSPLEVWDQLLQGSARGCLEKAADGHVDRMDSAAAQYGQQLIAVLFQPQAPLHRRAVVGRHLEAALVPQEIGSMQQMNVQTVALDPFATVEQPAELADLGRHNNPQGGLDGMHGGHLVRDRADAADAGGDIGGFENRTSAKQRLEQSRRFEDPQFHPLQFPPASVDVQRPFSLDAGQHLNPNRPFRFSHEAPLLRWRVQADRRRLGWWNTWWWNLTRMAVVPGSSVGRQLVRTRGPAD